MFLDPQKKITKARCPGRISLSKHADYINSHLLYLLDDRETQVHSQFIEGESVVKLSNKEFGNREIKLEEIDKALEDKSDWSFYIFALIKEIKLQEKIKNFELRIEVKSNLPARGGLSSSHALLLSSLRNFTELFNLKEFKKAFEAPLEHTETCFEIIKLCQKIEKQKGFNSGLGDQCAQLFSKKGYITSIKIFPDLKIKYIKIPENLCFITVPSYIEADKSAPEFIAKNKNIEKYRNLNELSKKYGCDYLADLHEKLSEDEIFDFLDSIDDLSENFNIEALKEHLYLSHQAEVNYRFDNNNNAQEIAEIDKVNYFYDRNLSLKKHSGYYHASTKENDQLQKLALDFDATIGSSITGAGFGGNNIVVIEHSQAEALKEHLIKGYYSKNSQNEDLSRLHISKGSCGVSLCD